MKFVVAHVDFSNNEIVLEQIEAKDWQTAVELHSRYPYREQKAREENDEHAALEHIPKTTANELANVYSNVDPEESFKQCCFDCDSMMNWIEIS
jgi:hypothetical protein